MHIEHDPVLEPRLINWARWCKPGKILYPINCVGLESKYRSPQCWDQYEVTVAIDILDAQFVEDKIVLLPKPYKKALKHWYVTRLDPRWIAKKCGYRDAGQLMRDTYAELKKTLDTHKLAL